MPDPIVASENHQVLDSCMRVRGIACGLVLTGRLNDKSWIFYSRTRSYHFSCASRSLAGAFDGEIIQFMDQDLVRSTLY